MSRAELHDKLRSVLGSNNVYFQPPEGMQLRYPCVIYKLNTSTVKFADNKVYKSDKQYTATFMGQDPDKNYEQEMYDTFSMVRYDRRFKSDNLYNDVYIFYHN